MCPGPSRSLALARICAIRGRNQQRPDGVHLYVEIPSTAHNQSPWFNFCQPALQVMASYQILFTFLCSLAIVAGSVGVLGAHGLALGSVLVAANMVIVVLISR